MMDLKYFKKKSALETFYEEALDMFVRPQGFTQYVLLSNTGCTHRFCLLTRKLNRAPLL